MYCFFLVSLCSHTKLGTAFLERTSLQLSAVSHSKTASALVCALR